VSAPGAGESGAEASAEAQAAETLRRAATTSDPPTREELATLLRLHGGRVAAVARALCRSRAQIYRWMELNAIDPTAFRD